MSSLEIILRSLFDYIDLEKDITAPEENAGPTAPSPLLSIKSIPTEYPLPTSIARLKL
jgi:hypothetical protein